MSLELACLLASSFVLQQHPARAEFRDVAESVASTTAVVFAGSVVGPEGLPAAGVVVVSSAGGEAVTDADGSFTLVASVPLAAESVDVSATSERAGRDSLTASVRLVPSALTSTTSVGTLRLGPSGECRPRWLPTFGGMPGTDDAVLAFAVFDDGRGPALYAGGEFKVAGAALAGGVARWNGARWSGVGAGATGSVPSVYALAVFDDGNGAALYAAGTFTGIGGVAAGRIARFDGTGWSVLGGGETNGAIRALAVFDDGGGPALYATGEFTSIEGVAAIHIARWDGTSWSPLASGLTGVGTARGDALTVFDDGDGPALYVGGHFTVAGGVSARGTARWDGTSWSGLASVNPPDVEALAVFDDGNGAALYAGGEFTTAGGVTVNRIARWDGASWSALSTGTNGRVDALAVFDDGSGPALYAGGNLGVGAANGVARWDGQDWSAVGPGIAGVGFVAALETFDRGHGAELFAGGSLPDGVVRWDGTTWSDVGTGVARRVDALATFDDGVRPALYALGSFTTAGGGPLDRVGRWDGASWSSIDSVLTGFGTLETLLSFEEGGGPALFVGGAFNTIDGVASPCIARWDGAAWSTVGGGITGGSGPSPTNVFALAEHDDGNGPALYAGGHFSVAGGTAANCVARWDGSGWSALGSGLGSSPTVLALASFDDGGGPALYAAGVFNTAGGIAASNVARWDGTSWSPLGSGTNAMVLSLAVFDDGGGPALYAGGIFTVAGGLPASHVARWDGAGWSAVGGGTNDLVEALAVFDDGDGPALFAAGAFITAGGGAALHVARWDGASWSALGGGLTTSNDYALVHALSVFDDGAGPALFAGGLFPVSPSGDSHLAKWACSRKVLRTH